MPIDILIVDDESDICDLVGGILADEGYETRVATTGVDALELILERQPHLVILDIWLGDSSRDGLKILETIKRDHPNVPVVMMSGHATVETAVASIKLGAYDFIEKPFQADHLLLVVARAIEAARLKRENQELRIKAPYICSLVGGSSRIQEIKQELESAIQTNRRLFIHGPIGCDRGAIAKYTHDLSNDASAPFLSINCSTVDPNCLEAEIFGLEVISSEWQPRKIGMLEHAHGGTFFIDEISFLPTSSQTKLSSFLQSNKFVRAGGVKAVEVNVRVIGGSSLSKEDIMKFEEVKSDLYYRMSVVEVSIPPLAERVRDIGAIVKEFVSAIAASHNIIPRNISPEAMSVLEIYPWPGDVQQLKNVVEWILVMSANNHPSEVIGIENLPTEIIRGNEFAKSWNSQTATLASLPIKEAREIFEREYITSQIRRFGGHISQTARFIGMDRASLHRKLKNLGINMADGSFVDDGLE